MKWVDEVLRIKNIRQIEYVDEDEILEAIELAVVVAEAGAHEQLSGLLKQFLDQLSSVVGATRLGWLLDWWLVCRFGERSNGSSFQAAPPFEGALQSTLELLRQSAGVSEVPVLLAVRHRRKFDVALEQFRTVVYREQGKARVQGETWDRVEAWYHPIVEALTARQAVEAPSHTKADLRSVMKDVNVRPGSDLWRKIERDWEEVDEACRSVVAMTKEPAHAYVGAIPEVLPVTELVGSELHRRVESRLLADVLGLEIAQSDLDAVITAPAIDSSEDEEWLATLTYDYFEQDRRSNHRLRAACDRIRQARKEVARLERADLDVAMAVLYLDDGDVTSAEQVLETARSERSRDDRRRSLSAELDRLEDAARTAEMLEEMTEEFDLVRADLSDGAFDEVSTGIHRLKEQLAAQIGEARLERASQLMIRLLELGGKPDDSDRVQIEQARSAGSSIDDDVVPRLEDAVDQAEASVWARVDERIRLTNDRLDDERQVLDAIVVDEVSRSLDLARHHLAEDSLVAADRESRRALNLLEQAVPRVWEASEGEDLLVGHIREYARCRLGFVENDLDRLYVSLKTKKFAILSGLTGSGKSTIARLFAEAVGATPGNGRFLRIAVRPNWVDETDVLGYINPTSGRFEPGWLAALIRSCHRTPDLPVFCLLDEMNLAPVEYYLADYLSALEEAGAGSDGTRVSLYSAGASPVNGDEWPDALPFPDNLFLIGTVNVDESTRPLSDRVLDRANVIQLNVEVGDRHHAVSGGELLEPRWQVRMRDWRAICAAAPTREYHETLVDIGKVLVSDLRLGLGVRAHIEIERFIANAAGVIGAADALDAALLQRLLPKIKGFKRDLSDGLATLKQRLVEAKAVRCAAVIEDWLDDTSSEDTYIDGTAARVGLVSGN